MSVTVIRVVYSLAILGCAFDQPIAAHIVIASIYERVVDSSNLQIRLINLLHCQCDSGNTMPSPQ